MQAIIKTYQTKKRENQLANNLLNPTCAKIKSECRLICEERLGNKDANCIRTFFGGFGTKKEVGLLIEKMPLSKFKPLDNFLKNDCQGDTDDKNIELLAWLIDFQPRPFDSQINYESADMRGIQHRQDSKVDTYKKGKSEDIKGTNDEVHSRMLGTNKNKRSFRPDTLNLGQIIPIGFLALVGFGVIWLGKNSLANSPTPAFSCMYWAGDRYESVPCNFKSRDALVIALDSFKLLHFKRITVKDTITYASIGVLWYAKPKRDSVEFYTAEGFHPINYDKRLKPLTKYMIDKYVLKDKKSSLETVK